LTGLWACLLAYTLRQCSPIFNISSSLPQQVYHLGLIFPPLKVYHATTVITTVLPAYKQAFLQASLDLHALQFVTFELKSGRQSPYFFNASDFYNSDLLNAFIVAYTNSINSAPSLYPFNVIFGPAYKCIPLAFTTFFALRQLNASKYGKL
jgi:hypothetical protein